MLETILLGLTVLSWLYWVVAWWSTRAFFRTGSKPLPDFTPAVSILKPVKGLDAQAYQNFASFCRQDYPGFELLFGVADPTDPVIPIVRRLQREFPQCDIRLVIAPALGTNPKVSILHGLAAQARHETFVISDSDIRVTPDYLRRVVAPLADARVGLVTCLYRGEAPLTFTARLEALHMGVTFLPSAIVAHELLSVPFAMGATMVLRREDLNRIGGFAAVADYLADDYQVSARITRLGLRVHLSDYVVASVLGATTFRDQWDREVRWARCIRVSRPWEYPGLLLTFSTPLATVFALATGFSPSGQRALAISLLLRWLVAWRVTAYTDDREARRWLVWLPVRDLLSALIWCMGAMGRHVVWRGERFALAADGRLVGRATAPRRLMGVRRAPAALLKAGVRGVDALLRRWCRIQEFSQQESCLFRIALGTSDRDLVLSDGTRVRRGERVGELHFWNERIPPMPAEGPDLAWAVTFHRRLSRSLAELTAYIERDPAFRDIKAFRGETSFGSQDGFGQLARLAERWGFDLLDRGEPDGIWHRFLRFWENLYVWGIIWAFNPGSLRRKRFRKMRRGQLWISRKTLVARYGDKRGKPDGA